MDYAADTTDAEAIEDDRNEAPEGVKAPEPLPVPEAKPWNGPPPNAKNSGDLRHVLHAARRRYEVYTADMEPLHLANTLRGRAAFLICNGPSLNDLDLSLLSQPGVVTMGINNGPAVFVPNYWVAVDGPERFVEQIWKNPNITKFVPLTHKGKKPRVRMNGVLQPSAYTVEQMPATYFFQRNEYFDAATFLSEASFNWGAWEAKGREDAYGIRGGRSVMLVALKLLFWLGASTINIIGADFGMAPDRANYAFDQDRTQAAINSNNNLYEKLNRRFALLVPYLEQAGVIVWNCTPGGNLSAFPRRDYLTAVEAAAKEVNEKPVITEGMYN